MVRSPCWTSFTRGLRGLICASPCWVVTTFKQIMAKCVMWLLLRALLLESVSWGGGGLIGSPCVENNRCNCNPTCYNPIGTLPKNHGEHPALFPVTLTKNTKPIPMARNRFPLGCPCNHGGCQQETVTCLSTWNSAGLVPCLHVTSRALKGQKVCFLHDMIKDWKTQWPTCLGQCSRD